MRAVGGAVFERVQGAQAYLDISAAILDLQNEFISAIIASHVTGYSTTSHDLLHELIPWAR